MRRLFDRSHADRTIPAMFAVYFTWSALWLFALWRDSNDSVFMDWLWPWVFALGASLSALYAWHPENLRLHALSCSVMVGACVSRAWAVFSSMVLGTANVSYARSWFGVGTWLAFGFGLSYIWVGSLHHLCRQRRRGG